MTDRSVVEVIIPDVPPMIRASLINDARNQGISVNEVAARILAARCNIDRADVNTRFVPVVSESRLTFRVPTEVRRCLRLEAAQDGATIRGLVIAALADRYDIPFDGTGRRPRTAA